MIFPGYKNESYNSISDTFFSQFAAHLKKHKQESNPTDLVQFYDVLEKRLFLASAGESRDWFYANYSSLYYDKVMCCNKIFLKLPGIVESDFFNSFCKIQSLNFYTSGFFIEDKAKIRRILNDSEVYIFYNKLFDKGVLKKNDKKISLESEYSDSYQELLLLNKDIPNFVLDDLRMKTINSFENIASKLSNNFDGFDDLKFHFRLDCFFFSFRQELKYYYTGYNTFFSIYSNIKKIKE